MLLGGRAVVGLLGVVAGIVVAIVGFVVAIGVVEIPVILTSYQIKFRVMVAAPIKTFAVKISNIFMKNLEELEITK